jgi:uncharacterized hydrophobic protein (TIGR00341 family)
MALRLVDVYRSDDGGTLDLPEEDYTLLGHWTQTLDDGVRLDRILVDADETESLIEWLDRTVGTNDYRIVIQSAEATLPRPEPEADTPPEATADDEEDETSVDRINREELYQYARDAADVGAPFYALVLLSTIVAAGGMLRDQVAVVIGAMVIAPLIGPNIALSLGTTLGDTSLLRKTLWGNVTGMLLALTSAVGLGWVLAVDPSTAELAARTTVGFADIALAVAAGAAGALSVTRGASTTLVGVMVAVALLPPVVACGLLVGDGHLGAAGRAGLLTLTNVVCINLAAVGTFLVRGVRPMRWREAEQAKTSTRIALALWLSLLAVLALAIWLLQ